MSISARPAMLAFENEPDSDPPERTSSVEPVPSSVRRRSALASEAYDIAVGDLICGKFRVERIVGEGGMGLVVAATHLGLDERVALKLLHPDARKNPEAIARFFQEAKAAAKLKSDHVAHVLDVSQRQDGCPFIVMELLRGSDLRHVLNVDGTLSVETTVDYMIQACEGLAEAHARGIVHRDIKPENLFLAERSQGWRIVKILDFGISKAMLASSSMNESNIRTGAIMGSPSYMSPEQLRETATVDHRTDIWALGAVMYELLAGACPFDSDRPLTALIVEILQDDPTPLNERCPHVPTGLSQIVARCMEKDRDDRFATAADLAIALLPYGPRGARVAVERAIAVTNEAGGESTRALTMPNTIPPLVSTRAAGLQRTALALDVELPPISSRQIVTHPDLIAEMGRTARSRFWAYVAVVGIAALALVTVVAILQSASPSVVRVPPARARAVVNHVSVSSAEERSVGPSDAPAPVVLTPPKPIAPRAPVQQPSPPGDSSLEIRGTR